MIKITQEDFIEIHKCSLFQESNPILIARKINSIGTNAIKNKAIDDLLNTTIRLEVQNNTLPIGNWQIIRPDRCHRLQRFLQSNSGKC